MAVYNKISFDMNKKVEISHQTIFFILSTIAAVWVFGKIADLLLLIFVSGILMAALKPAVSFLSRFKLPRGGSIAIIYLALWSTIGGIFASLIPALVEQTRTLLGQFPGSLSQVEYLSLHQQEITSQIISSMGTIPVNVARLASGVFSNVLNLVTVIVISFYLLVERENLDKIVARYIGSRRAAKVSQTVTAVEHKLGGWVRAELMLMIFVGTLTYLGLKVLGMENALPLALLAGMLEIVPSIGPTISAIPAIIIALTIHPLLAVSTAALYFLVQFIENNFLVPQIMEKAAGVNPLVSIISLMIGFRLAGTVGAIISIPTVLVLETVITHYWSLPQVESSE